MIFFVMKKNLIIFPALYIFSFKCESYQISFLMIKYLSNTPKDADNLEASEHTYTCECGEMVTNQFHRFAEHMRIHRNTNGYDVQVITAMNILNLKYFETNSSS